MIFTKQLMARKNNLTSVITGDLINSRKVKKPSQWLDPLKKALRTEGKTPEAWEIYRGDSFQVEVKNPSDAFLMAIRIKATIKCIKNLDVRMAIGIGTKEFTGSKLTESNGEAFINSGEKLEGLKKEKYTLAIKTPWADFDKEMNLYIRLALIAMDNWSRGSAELMSMLIDRKDTTQKKLAGILGIYQSSVSERQKRANYTEIMELESLYREKINHLIS